MATIIQNASPTQISKSCIKSLAWAASIMTPDDFCAEVEKTFSGKITKSINKKDRAQIFHNLLQAAVICNQLQTDALFHFRDENHPTHRKAAKTEKIFLTSLEAVVRIYTGKPRFESKLSALAFDLSWLPILAQARQASSRPAAKIELPRTASKKDRQLNAA